MVKNWDEILVDLEVYYANQEEGEAIEIKEESEPKVRYLIPGAPPVIAYYVATEWVKQVTDDSVAYGDRLFLVHGNEWGYVVQFMHNGIPVDSLMRILGVDDSMKMELGNGLVGLIVRSMPIPSHWVGRSDTALFEQLQRWIDWS